MSASITLKNVTATGLAQTPTSGLKSSAPVTSTISFFPYSGRWHGADVAYSIELSPNRYLWLFGDTYVGKPDAQRTARDSMPRNSIGIADCASGACRLTYAWNEQSSGAPTAFFSTGSSEWYWPLDGFVEQEKLYVVLEKMHSTGDGGALGFDYSGVVLASVENYMDPPTAWKIRYQTILSGNTVIPGVATVSPAAAARAADSSAPAGFAYFFTWVKKGHSPEIALVRLPAYSLADVPLASGKWQYLTKNESWSPWTTPELLPEDAKPILHGNFTELTVVFHPELRRWLMTVPGSLMDGSALFSYANSLTGNWAGPHTLYRYPESQHSHSDEAEHIFCYAAKEHPELEARGMFTLTYACNSMKQAEVISNPHIYHPVVVSMPISKLVGPVK